MTFCERLQQFLVEKGAAELKGDAEAQQHLVDCNDCFDFLEGLQQVDATLARMPEHDAPNALVQKTLAAITSAETPAAARATPPPPPLNAIAEARARRWLTWMRAALAWIWGIASFRSLRKRVADRATTTATAPEAARPRWRRILTSPKFLIPATATPSLLLLSTMVVFITTGTHDAPMVMGGENETSIADSTTRGDFAAKQLPISGGGGGGSGYRVSRLRELNTAPADDLVARRPGPALRGGDNALAPERDSLGDIAGTKTGEAEGMAGLGIRGTDSGDGDGRGNGGIGGIGAVGTSDGGVGLATGRPAPQKSGSRFGHAQPASPPMDAPPEPPEEVRAPERFARVVPDPEPAITPEPEPNEPDTISRWAPDKPSESATFELVPEQQPGSGAKDRVDELRQRNQEIERKVQRELTKRVSPKLDEKGRDENNFKKKKKEAQLEVESKPPGATLAFDFDESEISEDEGENFGETDIAKSPDRHKGKEGGKRDSGRYGYLTVHAPGADGGQVLIDGRIAGNAPVTMQVAEGQHRVQLRLSGYEDKERSVRVTAENDRRNPVNVNLGNEVAREFLAERARTDGLRFKRADGYWANTYVPGDAAMRLLAARLERSDRTALGGLRLDRAARQYAQPFDAPTTSALDVYLHADQAGLQGESRMLVQVGIKGTPRRSRSRPTMNVGVVLDLSGSPATEQQNAMRALVMALGDARDIGDRFSLVVAGRPGGLVVPAASFKHGPLTVAMRSLLGGESAGETLSLRQATERAIGIVVGEDDPSTPLGSSVVLVVTPNTLDGRELHFLTEMAHESAVNGVPISTVGVGANVSMEQLDQLTLAGQGNRRLMSAPSEAEPLVDRELSSVSRVIARAVRLRVRLAKGVKLINVIGSHRLDEERSEQVRQAEQSIDRRMSRNLGVTSDRGEDEDGIQMVIPSYYAGDTHVILLDVVAPGAGPIADVRVRYKDLVYLKNGVSRANLTVKRGALRAGPLEHNVLKNFLARNVAAALERAGILLDAGDAHAATAALTQQATLLAALMGEMPALASDRDLLTDISMLTEYTSILTTVAHEERDYVADSLRYAAFLKVLPRPTED